MSRTIVTGILLGIVSVLPISAHGQSSVLIGPHLGIQRTSGADGSNYLAGGTLRLKLTPLLGVEGDVSYRQEKFGGGALTIKQWPVTVTGLIYPLPIVYGGLGAGWYNTTFDYAETYNMMGFANETDQKFGWHLAAGVELPASPNVRIFGDVRYVFLNYKLKELPDAVLDGAKSDFYSINLGMLFRL